MTSPRRRCGVICPVVLLSLVLVVATPSFAQPPSGLPLEPARTIELTTDETTWMSVDVSPDGSTLLVDVLGDLYTLPFEVPVEPSAGAAVGGEGVRRGTRITEGMAFDSQPRFSPDGRSIAFLSDRGGAENLWVARADGTDARKLSSESFATLASPAWTADGRSVLVSILRASTPGFELWMFDAEGGQGIQLTETKIGPAKVYPLAPVQSVLGAQALADGTLYFARKMGRIKFDAEFPMWQIARRDPRDGSIDELTALPGSAIRPVLSPDGRRLVYGTRVDGGTDLRVRDLVTGADRLLRRRVQRDEQETKSPLGLLPGYAFLPDGASLVASWDGKLHRVDLATGAATDMPFEIDVRLDLGPELSATGLRVDEGPVRARLVQGARLSPDGRRIAFSSLTRLWVADLPATGSQGGGPVEVVPERLLGAELRGYQPAWSPDGRWIAYVTWDADTQTDADADADADGGRVGHVWKVAADGSSPPRRLTAHSAFYAEPAFSPDGTRLVALRGNAWERARRWYELEPLTGLDVVQIPADASEPAAATVVVPARGVGRPHFRADDPDRIYAYLGADAVGQGPGQLVSFRWDGSDRRDELSVGGAPYHHSDMSGAANDLRLAPRGPWALAEIAKQLWLVALPSLGGTAPHVKVQRPALPVHRLTDIGADDFDWSADGETVVWTVGSTVHRRTLASILAEPGDQLGAPLERVRREDQEGVETFALRVEVPRDQPAGVVVLRGGTVYTMATPGIDDARIENADVVVDGHRIVALGPVGTLDLPEGARIVDAGGTTILPGFVDTHAHWVEVRRGVLDVDEWGLRANLAWGVTAGLDVQTFTVDTFAYQDLLDAGEMLGPRAFSTGPGVFSNQAFQSYEQTEDVLRRYRDHYRTRSLKAYVTGNRRQRQWVVQASEALGLRPTTEGSLDFQMSLTHALDGFAGTEHNLSIAPLGRDVVQLVTRSGMGLSPTLVVTYGGPWAENVYLTRDDVHDDPKVRRFVPHHVLDQVTRRRPWVHPLAWHHPEVAAQAAKIIRAGGVIGVGSHGQLQGPGFHWELWSLATGMTEYEALRCATALGARMIGYADDLGTIEPGKLADLVVLDADPTEDIARSTSIRWVMKNGRLYDAESLEEVQ